MIIKLRFYFCLPFMKIFPSYTSTWDKGLTNCPEKISPHALKLFPYAAQWKQGFPSLEETVTLASSKQQASFLQKDASFLQCLLCIIVTVDVLHPWQSWLSKWQHSQCYDILSIERRNVLEKSCSLFNGTQQVRDGNTTLSVANFKEDR